MGASVEVALSNQLIVIACLGLTLFACEESTPASGGSGGQLAATSPESGGASLGKGGSSSNKGGSSSNKGGKSSNEGGSSNGGKDSSNEGGSASEGGAGSEGGSSSEGDARSETGECVLTATEDTGWVDAATNDCKIQGAWYAYSDCTTSAEDCTTGQVPAPGSDAFPNSGGKICTSGTTVAINKEYDTKWGAGIGLNLNQPTDSEDKNPISELPHAITGFSFTISGDVVPAEVRVTYPTAQTEKTAHFKKIVKAGDYTVSFGDAAQGSWVKQEQQVDLVPGNVTAIQFQVVGADTKTIDFDFCVENLKALY
jgi:hypothetical protein